MEEHGPTRFRGRAWAPTAIRKLLADIDVERRSPSDLRVEMTRGRRSEAQPQEDRQAPQGAERVPRLGQPARSG